MVGLAYNLGTSSLAQNTTLTSSTSDLSVSMSGSTVNKPSYMSTICVRGKQRLEVQGPRLNVTKEEKTGKIYGPDRRLDLVVQEEMPILNVSSVLQVFIFSKLFSLILQQISFLAQIKYYCTINYLCFHRLRPV